MRFYIPIELKSLLNERMHWRALAALKKTQRVATNVCMHGLDLPTPPLLVTITRIGPRRLDDDNLSSACKYVRDEIARAIGVDDGSSIYTWIYKQQTGKYGVDVEIVSRESDAGCKQEG